MGPKKWWHYLILFVLVGALVLTALTALAVTIIYPSLPSLESLTNYHPKLPLKVYSAEGLLIGEFGEERRAFVNIEDVPKPMKDAVLAIEDRRFYEHHGIDTTGVIRAVRNNLTGRGHEGASTITMQVAKNFFSKPDSKRDMLTKIKEAMLAIKIEKALSKDKILELYLNQIFLGQRAYGFAAASQVYFGKQLKDLNLAECALLAGLPKAPSRYNPYFHKVRATTRQNEVLRDMKRYQFINQDDYDQAIKFPLVFKSAKTVKNLSADYVAEIVRISMFNRFGEDIYSSGYKVYTTIKKQNQEAANAAIVQGIVDYDLRHGYRGPEKNIALNTESDIEDAAKNVLVDTETFNGFTPALVTKIGNDAITVVIANGEKIDISGASLALIKPHLLAKTDPKLAVRVGSIIRIANLNAQWRVVQLPQIEASLIALNPETGEVNALIGGFDFTRNKFNHVTQAWRQPGSSFKPFIYSAALEKGLTPASIIDDAPFSLSAEETGSTEDWEPQNFDEKFSGPMRMRTALVKSKNMVSIRIMQKIGPRYAQSYITKFGFAAKDHPPYLATALGAGSTTSWMLAAAYGVFANSGYLVRPYLITKIIDANGEVIESVNPAVHISTNRVIDPRNVFIMTNMMQDVIKVGTGKPALKLGRTDIAGKTGTTNNQMDVWFAGYNPKEVAVAWMGFDSPKSLGKDETGGKAALPIWIKYMEVSLKNMPNYNYKVPEGIIKLKVNGRTGTLVNDFDYGVFDYFYSEHRPPEQQIEIPSLEESTDYNAPTDDNSAFPENMTTNPLQPQPPAAPPEEKKGEPVESVPKPSQGSGSVERETLNQAARLLNPSQ